MAINTFDIPSDQERKEEGAIGAAAVLTINMPDSELRALLDYKLRTSEAFWNGKGIELDKNRERSEKYWTGTYQDDLDFFSYQFPYVDNRIFMSLETIIPIALSRPPEPDISPAKDTDASRQLADDVKKVLLAKYQKQKLRGKFRMSLRHLLLYRLGALKYRWNKDIGDYGDIEVDWVRPQKLVIDKGAIYGKEPEFIGEYMEGTIEALVDKYPDKKADIWKKFHIIKGTQRQLSQMVGYYEMWFKYTDKQGKPQQGVCWKCDEIILDKMKNPNWDYTGEEEFTISDEADEVLGGPGGEIENIYHNHFSNPKMPYVFLNYLNLGRRFIDDIALAEVAFPLQKVVDKRGQQIVENADGANSGWVFNKEFISKPEAQKLTGAYNEKVVGDGDVRSGAARLPPPALPAYVIEDKFDARNEIDNLLGTHSTTRGERGKKETLGGRILLKEADTGRIGDLVNSAIEPAAEALYNGIVQLMKVFYVKEHFIKHIGADGERTFLEFDRDKIEDGIEIIVKSGTTMPTDKSRQRAEALELSKAGLIDPMTLFEALDHPNPKEEARRMVLYNTDPAAYLKEILGVEDGGGDVMRVIERINSGEYSEPPAEVTEEYLAEYTKFVQSPDFDNLEPEIQVLHTRHLAAANEKAKAAMGEEVE